MTLDPTTLILRINESFAGVPYPGDDQIVRDEGSADLEARHVGGVLRGHHWRDVSFEALEGLRHALPFLSVDGYRFYLPAFMVIAVADFSRADTIPDEVVRSLTPPRPADVDEMRELAKAHPELQPFDPGEWTGILETMEEAYRSGGPAEATFIARASSFEPAQVRAVRDFLVHMRDAHGDEFPSREPELALTRYWESAADAPAG